MVMRAFLWIVYCFLTNQSRMIISRTKNLFIETAGDWSKEIRIAPVVNVGIECIKSNLAISFPVFRGFCHWINSFRFSQYTGKPPRRVVWWSACRLSQFCYSVAIKFFNINFYIFSWFKIKQFFPINLSSIKILKNFHVQSDANLLLLCCEVRNHDAPLK